MRIGKSMKIGFFANLRARLVYFVITLCIGLIFFYMGRVEFLNEKLREAEKMVTMNNEDVYQHVAIHGFQQQSDASQPQIQKNANSNDFFQECALKFLSSFF